MRKAIATVSLSGTLRDKLEAIAAAGFDAVELFEADFINFQGDAKELKRIADGLGLGIDLYQPLRDFEGMPAEQHRRNLDRAERKFDLMQTLGAPLVLVCSNTSPQSLGDAELASAQLYELADRAARRGLKVGYEALAWGRHRKRWGEAWHVVERANHSHLGLILDSFHTLSLRDDPSGIASLPGDKIFFLQMADAPLLAMDVLQWARHHRNFPGQGQFDCENFLEQTLRAGYTGPLSLEIFNDVFRATPNRRTALDAMRSLLFLESRVRERLAQPPAAVATKVTLFEPPAAMQLDGFAFIEVGVDPSTSQRLGALLAQMGFACLGHHRSKDAVLYSQGDIRVVLNAEPGSDSRDRFDAQGTSVGTLGLETADPGRAAHYGAALLSARRDSPRGAQELELPAIVAPGGVVLQFVTNGALIESDFVGDVGSDPQGSGSASTGDAGLRRVDHVAIGVANDQIDTWTLFARAVLGLSLGESQELADPFGLIRSSGFSNDDRSMRVVLNSTSSEQTRSAREAMAHGRPGARVQHIALATDDIFASMTRLRASGVRFVPISANYYDDLIARLGLEEPLVRRMQQLGILFDSSPAGSFMHAYGEAFDDRFFFEIVQRSGYDGYGALNAAARLASQEQRQRA